jgi:hypothetical protein
MTDIPAQPWPAPEVQAGALGGRAPILLAIPEPTGQRRLTVLLRIILVIPHLVELWALGIVAEIIAVIGWFGALFTGRLPRFAEDYLSGYLHWQVRVSAYCVLLTEAYPPFALGDSDYPVRVAIPPPGPLNRLAVFFRLILAIPPPSSTGSDLGRLDHHPVHRLADHAGDRDHASVPVPGLRGRLALLRPLPRLPGDADR